MSAASLSLEAKSHNVDRPRCYTVLSYGMYIPWVPVTTYEYIHECTIFYYFDSANPAILEQIYTADISRLTISATLEQTYTLLFQEINSCCLIEF